jgi:hypothetical protein
LYVVRGQPTIGDESDEEQEAPETAVGPRIQSRYPREERESLLSTDRRLSWCEWTEARGGVDSLRSSRFRVVARRRSSVSSFVQVLRMAPGSEGAPTSNNVMDLRTGAGDGDDNEYIPR